MLKVLIALKNSYISGKINFTGSQLICYEYLLVTRCANLPNLSLLEILFALYRFLIHKTFNFIQLIKISTELFHNLVSTFWFSHLVSNVSGIDACILSSGILLSMLPDIKFSPILLELETCWWNLAFNLHRHR